MPMVASEPMPISISPSPVMTATRRSNLIWSTPSFCPNSFADQLLRQQHGGDALVAEHVLHGALGRAFDLVCVAHAIDFRLAQLEHRIDDRSHRHLPGIELLPLAAHGDQHQQRKPAGPCTVSYTHLRAHETV